MSDPASFPLARPANVPAPNCMNKIVRWLTSDQVSRARKVMAIALAIIATLAVGCLVGRPIIVFTAVALSAGIWANIEAGKIRKTAAEEDPEAALERVKDASLAQMLAAFGGLEKWDGLPTKYANEPVYYPIMRGASSYGAPFVAMKWRQLNRSSIAIVIISEQTNGSWSYHYGDDRTLGELPLKDRFDQKDWDTIRQVVEGKHTVLEIAR